MKSSKPVRIGMVNFINTAPIYEIWKKTVQRSDWQIVAAPPSELNRMLYQDELDLGCVSSFEYAVHPQQYKSMGNLSISASGPVGSVFLFSRVEPDQLSDKLVLLSGQSQTSVSLVKIILEEFYSITPRYQVGNVMEHYQQEGGGDAVLAIGDEALRLLATNEYPIRLDLGEVWHQHTGLPFVFALWTVRVGFCDEQPEQLAAIHGELLRCLAEGQRDLQAISREVAPRIPMDREACWKYLKSIEYDFGPEKQQALKLFYEFLIKRNEADPAALPLKIYPEQV
jgi:chorismate dehydratase